jgi:hypothetical protein
MTRLKGGAVPAGPLEFRLCQGEELTPVPEPRQRVGRRHPLDLGSQAPLLDLDQALAVQTLLAAVLRDDRDTHRRQQEELAGQDLRRIFDRQQPQQQRRHVDQVDRGVEQDGGAGPPREEDADAKHHDADACVVGRLVAVMHEAHERDAHDDHEHVAGRERHEVANETAGRQRVGQQQGTRAGGAEKSQPQRQPHRMGNHDPVESPEQG